MTTTDNHVLDAALAYAARGWRVFPVHTPTPNGCSCGKSCRDPGKHPRPTGWQQGGNETAIRAWWKKWPNANIGVVTGAVSGFFVLDIDAPHGEESLADLEGMHGKLPGTVESQTGGGGRHLLFGTIPGLRVRNINDGSIGNGLDVKGDGGFIVAPPSIHHSGDAYIWESSSEPESTPIAHPPPWLIELVTERAETTEKPETTETTDIHLSALSGLSVTEVIERTLPLRDGQRNACVFRLAWMLKSMPEYKDKPIAGMREIVRQWHQLALPIIGTKPFDVTWADFVHAWPRVKHVVGNGPWEQAVARADAAVDPPEAANYDSDKAKRLMRLSRELQRIHGEKPFYLSSRMAAKLLDTDRSSASRMLRMFCADGVLELVELGLRGGLCAKASRFRYRAAA